MGKPKKTKPKKSATRPRNTLTLVSVSFPQGPSPRDLREMTVKEFLAWRLKARQPDASEVVHVVPAVGGQFPGRAQRRPLPPPKPHPGGSPFGKGRTFTDEAIRAARDARTSAGRPLSVKQQEEIAQELGAHVRTVQRRLKYLPK